MLRWLHPLLLIPLLALSVLAQSTPGITAEARGQANLRAAASLESALLGEIRQGQRWPVLASSEHFPWLLLGDATGEPLGWVYADLVNLSPASAALPVSTLVLTAQREVTATALPDLLQPVASATVPAALTAMPATTVFGSLAGIINIRQGPGVEYSRVAVGQAGERYEISARHSLRPWVQIIDARAPNGRAWIARDLLQIQGDLTQLPIISQPVLHLPTLTPTPSLARITARAGIADGRPEAPTGFVETGQQAWDLILAAGFERESGRPAALYLLDLGSGVGLGFHERLAFSGTSIQKINILTALFGVLESPLSRDTAVDIANTMICSENLATNRLLARIGRGDSWAGAAAATRLLKALDMPGSFIVTPYTIPGQTAQPPAETQVIAPQLPGDSVVDADPWNRILAGDVGQQLGSLYYCAQEEDNPLSTQGLEPRECRQALQVMSNNTVDALLKAGVPERTQVAHKHGWIADTHSNAALFFTPGGDYVIVLLLHQPQWLDFQRSLPLMAEVSRLVYNLYNPDQPLAAVRAGYIPEAGSCDFTADPLIGELLTAQ